MQGFSVEVGDAVGAAPDRHAGPCALVLFGATGDLAGRKLIPALYNLELSGALPDGLVVVGVSRSVPEVGRWAESLHQNTMKHSRTQPLDPAVWARFAERLHTVPGDLGDAASLEGLRALLARLAPLTHGNALFYLSTPSSAAEGALRALHGAGLLPRVGEGEPWRRVIVEKPFGRDLGSATALNRAALSLIGERQLFHGLVQLTLPALLGAPGNRDQARPAGLEQRVPVRVHRASLLRADDVGSDGRWAQRRT